MIGKIDPGTRGFQVWVNEVFDCRGQKLGCLCQERTEYPLGGGHEHADFGQPQYIGTVQTGVINDNAHGYDA